MGKGGSTTIQAPAAPNYQESMRDILKAQVEMAPEVYAREAQYQPLYNALGAAQQAFQAQQSLNIAKQAYPQIAEMEAAYNAANRQAELSQLQTALPQYQQAFNALTPGYAEAVGSAGQLAKTAMAQSMVRPQFSSYQTNVRDPYGTARPSPQGPPPGYSQGPPQGSPQGSPQGAGKATPPPSQAPSGQGGYSGQMQEQILRQQGLAPTLNQQAAYQQAYSQNQQAQTQPAQPAQPASKIQYDQGLEDRFKQLTTDMQGKLPGMAPAPKDPGPAIAPQWSPSGKGSATRIKNQSAIDTRNTEIAKYKTDLTAFNESEAKLKAGAGEYLRNFDPAAALASQQPASSGLLGAAVPPMSAAGGQAIPGVTMGAMQGPPAPAQLGLGEQVAQQAQAANLLGAGAPPIPSVGGPGIMVGQQQGPALPPQMQGQQSSMGTGSELNAQLAQGRQFTEQAQQGPSGRPQGAGKATPPSPQGQGGYSNQMQEQILRQQGVAPRADQVSAYQQAYSQNQQGMQGQEMSAPASKYQQGQGGMMQRAYDMNQQQQLAPRPPAMQGQPQGGGKATPPPPGGQANNFSGQMQQQMQGQGQQQFSGLQETPAGAYVNAVGDFTPSQKLASNIQNLDRNSVNQYISAMPGMSKYASMLSQQSQRELAAGKGLTPEEQRLADQSARSAYAARGTALGNQAIGAEILNRADVSNQRYQQRLQNAAQAAGTIQGIYQPALQQSMQRQQLGIQFGLNQQELLQSAQAQRYQQAMGREQLGAGTQETAFNQSIQRGQAEQQAYMASTDAQARQAQLGAGAMAQLQAAQAPILQAFYKQPILQGQENQAQQMAMAMQQQAGPQYFNPESQTGMGSIYGAYNSQMNLAGAQAQANAAKSAGKSGMMGALGGAAIGAIGIAF